MHSFNIFQWISLILLSLCSTCCNVFSINTKTKLLVFWFSPLRLHSAALNLTVTKTSLTVTVCVWIVLCSGCPVTSPIAGVNINERGRGFPLNTKGEEARKRRRRMRGGIVAVGCFASCLIFSLWPYSPQGGKVGLPPSLISPLPVFLYLCLNLWNLWLFLFHLLFSSYRPSPWPSILLFSPHFIAFPNSSTSISILHPPPCSFFKR